VSGTGPRSALQPAGLLGPLPGPLSENHVFQVTLHTSLQLHGRTAELPWSDFNRQVICHARHTVRYRAFDILIAAICIANDLPLYTKNIAHFSEIKDIRLLSPGEILPSRET
jgi:hypothetical protein